MRIPRLSHLHQITWTAFVVLFLVASAQPLRAQTSNTRSVLLSNWVNLNSSAVLDSFDSRDSAKSTNGVYDPVKRQSHAFLSFNNSTGMSDLHNAFIYGNVEYSGSAVRNTRNVQGWVATPSTGTISPVGDPTWAPGSYVQYLGGNNPPASGVFVANGTSTNPSQIKVVGDFTVPGGKTFSIVTDAQVERFLTVWVTGKFNVSGSARLNQDPMAHVTWLVDKDITASGAAYKNGSAKAANVSFAAVGTGKVTLSGNNGLIATFNAPGRDFSINGAGGLCGAMVGNTLTLGGGSGVHFDEALLATSYAF